MLHNERLLLLIAAIANNPSIGVSGGGVPPMEALQQAMVRHAQEIGVEYEPVSHHTIRKDIATLREWGIIPRGTALFGGYYLGRQQPDWHKQPRKPRATKSKLTPEEMNELKLQGWAYQAIADQAGISKQGVQSAVNRYRQANKDIRSY